MKIFISLLFMASPIFSQDSISSLPSSKNIDTVVIANEGTHKILVTNEKTFIEEYGSITGAFIGALLAALIAVYSVWKTNKNQRKIEKDILSRSKELNKNLYRGFLIIIHSILMGHSGFIESIDDEMKAMLADFKLKNRIAYYKPYSAIPIDLLKKLLIKFVNYENFNINIVIELSIYILYIDNFYNEIDLSNIGKLQKESNYSDMVGGYFNNLFQHIDMLYRKNASIQQALYNEINNLFGATSEVLKKLDEELKKDKVK
ncbi:MAG: hypothetical protein P4L27_08025 [Ignavibacteriaceae bacterium]|nr:hypothetical protein [Ignavibacteriaceae bacterium]